MQKKGKLIVIEGLDGCGKTTQAHILEKSLSDMGLSVRYVTFPDYEHESSALVKMYLDGQFGDKPEDVNAYAASSFFAVDRYASYKKYWQSEYLNGSIIIANRYTTANAPHQASKLPQEQWDDFLDWLFDYEYNKLGLPEPDMVIQLSMPPAASQKLLMGRYGGDESKRDIHERAVSYLEQCRKSAEYAAQRYGWQVIQCAQNDDPLPVDDISRMVWETVERSGLLND